MLKILSINDTCTGCGACVSICPKNALTLCYNEEGFYYPHLDENLCINCKLCERSCHILKGGFFEEPDRNFTPIMLKAKSREIVEKSSSGGAFSLLAESVLKHGGVVYGARYNYKDERLEHCSTDCCSLDDLRKSKYIESYLGNTFVDVKKQLKRGRKVLFCGTPCQIRGLSNYLDVSKTNKENLLLVRFICHGVPSNKFFTEYKHYIESKKQSKVTYIDFRPKTKGWRSSNLLLKFSNNKSLDEDCFYNYYYYYFQFYYLLRPSCYKCNLICNNDSADLTIADFWGIHMYRPENKDQEGISLVFLHSDVGRNAISSIADKCKIEILPQSAIDYVYKDEVLKSEAFKQRDLMMKSVLKNGYMKEAIKNVYFKIITLKIKCTCIKILKYLRIWKLIKK